MKSSIIKLIQKRLNGRKVAGVICEVIFEDCEQIAGSVGVYLGGNRTNIIIPDSVKESDVNHTINLIISALKQDIINNGKS